MRIDGNPSSQYVQVSTQSKEAQGADGKDAFASLLQNEISGQAQEISAESSVSGPESLPGLWGITSLPPNSIQSPEVSQAVSALDGVLSQFENLQNALLETTSPKEINGLIDQINAQAAGLDDKMSGLPADHQLRNLAEELKVNAYMESLKWNRGDYL